MHPSISAAKELVVPDTGNRNQALNYLGELTQIHEQIQRIRDAGYEVSIVIEAKPDLSEKRR
jgi:pyridoxine 5'-phosphate synthase PdxJ